MLKSLMPAVIVAGLSASTAAAADPVNYDEHIKPILRRHCLACHGDDKQEADLNLQSFAAAMKGGSGGKAFVPGRASASLLYQAVTADDADARMPLGGPPLPKEQIELIRKWIQEGLRESADSEGMAPSRDLSFLPSKNAGGKPDGPPPMPTSLPEVELPQAARPLPVLAMDVSPWAPLLAVSGQEHVRLIHTETQKELGVLPFPEGVPHVIRFSRDGKVLLVAGGKPVQSGKVVLYDVESGKRLAELGDEIDAVLAADLSPDQTLVALGGSGRTVKVYSTSDGELKYKLTKHTDWITAVGFSPDGSKLASADRAGGLHLWEAKSGGIVLTLAEHKAAIHSLHWRSDSRLLASSGEDGLLVWWDTADGWPAISKTNAHPPKRAAGTYGQLRNGILSASFGPGGNLLTAGRDRVLRYWSVDGETTKSFGAGDALPLTARISSDGKRLIWGDAAGKIHFLPAPGDGQPANENREN
jgi:mono/diheme cytochrome c family protein